MPATTDQMAAAQAALQTALGPQVLNLPGIASAIEMIVDARSTGSSTSAGQVTFDQDGAAGQTITFDQA